ncbi:MAG: hypothetical protein PHE53_05800 [Thermoguttaceae bacterium]|nr:hypothetical protein [Thermoguttaceae bacterium]
MKRFHWHWNIGVFSILVTVSLGFAAPSFAQSRPWNRRPALAEGKPSGEVLNQIGSLIQSAVNQPSPEAAPSFRENGTDNTDNQYHVGTGGLSQSSQDNRAGQSGNLWDQVDPRTWQGDPETLFPKDEPVQIPGFSEIAGWQPISLGGNLTLQAVYWKQTGYGIGRVEFTLPKSDVDVSVEEVGLSVQEQNSRIYYPSLEIRRIPRVVTGALQSSGRPLLGLVGNILDQPPRAVFYFLFTGTEPLNLVIATPRLTSYTVVPRQNQPQFEQAQREWWKCYTSRPGLLEQQPDYPPMVENYLKSMLAARLSLPLEQDPKTEPDWIDALASDLGIAGVTESMRLAYIRNQFAKPRPIETANIPISQLQSALPKLPDGYFEENVKNTQTKKEIEPLAYAVPAECFYVRFGKFENLVWLQDLMGRWGGDAQNLVASRAVDNQLQQRFMDRLQQRLDTVSRAVGPSVIHDVALIGMDTFFQDGSAFGMVFHAKSSFLFETSTNQSRAAITKKDPHVTLEKVTFGKTAGTLLASEDGRIRSYYVRVGDYHCIASSEHLAARFVEACQGIRSLAQCQDFQAARKVYPAEDGDAAFVFASKAFMQNLASPAYRIELGRRVRSIAEDEMFLLAYLAGNTERLNLPLPALSSKATTSTKSEVIKDPRNDKNKQDAKQEEKGETREDFANLNPTISVLRQYHFLPESFGEREDGSILGLNPLGDVVDSRRGIRGAFRPIPDMETDMVSATEASEYQNFVTEFAVHWDQLPPTIISMKRLPIDTAGSYYRPTTPPPLSPNIPNVQSEKTTNKTNDDFATVERIVIQGQVSYLLQRYIEPILSQLGPVQTDEVQFDPRERLTFELSLAQNRVFGAIRDIGVAVESLRTGTIPFHSLPDLAVGWFGFQGEPGTLAVLHERFALPPNANGLRRGFLNLWVGQWKSSWLYSFQPELILEVASHLSFVQSSHPAQLRVQIQNPENDPQLTSMIRFLSQGRAIRASAGNLRLLNQLCVQFRIPPEESRHTAELLLDARLVDPFEGDYIYQKTSERSGYWVTTNWADILAGRVANAPLLEWFRGLRTDLSANAQSIQLHLETAMQLSDQVRQAATDSQKQNQEEIESSDKSGKLANSPREKENPSQAKTSKQESEKQKDDRKGKQTSSDMKNGLRTESGSSAEPSTEESSIEDLLVE